MPNDKYEDEIRDILNRMDHFVPDGDQPKPRGRPSPPPWSGWLTNIQRQLRGYDSTSFLVGMVLFALLAGLLRRNALGSLAALAAVACLVIALLLPRLSGHLGMPERRWRGQVIDYRPQSIQRPFSWRYTWWRIKSFFGLR